MIQFKNRNITVFESQLFKTTSSVIQSRDCVIVVDPTWLPTEVEEIKQYVSNIIGNRTLYLLFTHSDWDHIIGYGAFPSAIVITSDSFDKRDDKEQILEQIREFDDKYYIDRDYPVTYPKVDIVIRENGQVLNIGDVSLTFYLAEGHTNDGIYTVVEPFGIWLSGDYLSNVEFPYIYFNSNKYEETLAKTENILQKHEIHLLVPGHGHVTECENEIKKRTQASFQYIRELRKAVEEGNAGFHLIDSYKYIRGMRNFHQGNIDLIEKELGK